MGERIIRPFGQFVHEQRGGKLANELAISLNQLVEAVLQQGKAGKLRLTLTVKPTKVANVLTVADAVEIKLPQPDVGEAMFFADKDFNLVRSDPNQMEFAEVRDLPERDVRNLRDVSTHIEEVR